MFICSIISDSYEGLNALVLMLSGWGPLGRLRSIAPTQHSNCCSFSALVIFNQKVYSLNEHLLTTSSTEYGHDHA